MVVLKVFKLDDAENILALLNVGQYDIGRGPLLDCNDQRVSRKQAIIAVEDNTATITAVHLRPCFFISATSTTVTILPKNTPLQLHDGDKIGLMPDQYWYKVELHKESIRNEIQTATDPAQIDIDIRKSGSSLSAGDASLQFNRRRLRKHDTVFNTASGLPSWMVKKEVEPVKDIAVYDVETFLNQPSTSNHKRKTELVSEVSPKIFKPTEDRDVLIDLLKNTTENSKLEETHHTVTTDKLNGDVLELEKSASFKGEALSESDDDESNKASVLPQSRAQDENNEASGSGTNQDQTKTSKTRRDRCWYGESCYRKNPDHRKEYSHPNDSDYESDPDDNRPLCPYGTNCYRRNKDHRKEYKHADTDSAKKTKHTQKKKNQKPAAAENKKKNVKYYESPEDDYDMEDPFIDDGSEDEYIADSASDLSDSEFNESENLEEDDTKRLVKEAKRFTRRGK